MSKPKIFIGSSTEGLNVAYAIQQNLEHYAEVTVWDQGIFQPSTSILITLVKSVELFDFAIFVFTPDDVTKIRGNDSTTVRDNVIFETGLFSGKLGLERVYFIKPRGDKNLHLPTDLLGIVAGEYDPNRSDGNLVASTGPFCNQVRQRAASVFRQGDTAKVIKEPVTLAGIEKASLERDLKIITVYIHDKGWERMSFQKILEDINPRLNEQRILSIIDAFPAKISRCKVKGMNGIRILPEPYLGP